MSELIDREATVKQICKMGEMVGGHDRDVIISVALFVQDDKSAFPTVERPHGEWIYHKEWELDGECAFECSKCGMGTDVDYNFCPKCGADMREEGDEK